jgi:hypothetical protein
MLKGSEGQPTAATLLDAGTSATELELLRTIVAMMNIQWGYDGLGWWAVVPYPVEPRK